MAKHDHFIKEELCELIKDELFRESAVVVNEVNLICNLRKLIDSHVPEREVVFQGDSIYILDGGVYDYPVFTNEGWLLGSVMRTSPCITYLFKPGVMRYTISESACSEIAKFINQLLDKMQHDNMMINAIVDSHGETESNE